MALTIITFRDTVKNLLQLERAAVRARQSRRRSSAPPSPPLSTATVRRPGSRTK